MLLVDSEEPVADICQIGEPDVWKPWQHLGQRMGDQWKRPDRATESECHLMVQCMESWLLADKPALASYFGLGFREKPLRATENKIEKIDKQRLFDSLAQATETCETKGPYRKGKHSFKLLAMIDPAKVMAASPWAKRFIDQTKKVMGA